MEFTKKARTSSHHIARLAPVTRRTSMRSTVRPLPSLSSFQTTERVSTTPITYFMTLEKMYSSELGEYKTYDIAVYHYLSDLPMQVIRDVSPDGDLVFRMVRAFNKHKLSPLHLMDAVKDMLG